MAHDTRSLWWLVGVTALVLAGLFLWMLLDDNVTDVTENGRTDQEDIMGTDSMLEQMTDNPQSYSGQTVTVEGEVQDSISNRVFSIADDPVDQEVLVVTRNTLSEEQVADMEPLFGDNARVEVTGEFRQFVAADIESEFDVDIDDEVEAEFEDHYVIVADNLTFTDEGQTFDFIDDDSGDSDEPGQGGNDSSLPRT